MQIRAIGAGLHTWIEGISEEEYLHDLAYAFTNKKWFNFDQYKEISYFNSYFLDGTEVLVTVKKNMFITETGQTYLGHFSGILINPKF